MSKGGITEPSKQRCSSLSPFFSVITNPLSLQYAMYELSWYPGVSCRTILLSLPWLPGGADSDASSPRVSEGSWIVETRRSVAVLGATSLVPEKGFWQHINPRLWVDRSTRRWGPCSDWVLTHPKSLGDSRATPRELGYNQGAGIGKGDCRAAARYLSTSRQASPPQTKWCSYSLLLRTFSSSSQCYTLNGHIGWGNLKAVARFCPRPGCYQFDWW